MQIAPQPSESLSVSGLPPHLSDVQLQALFSQYGTVDQCKMLDVIPGLPSRGALVTMATVDEAAWLVQNLNNNILSGLTTPVTVQFLAAPGEVSAPALAAPTLDLGALAALAAHGSLAAPAAPSFDAASLGALYAALGQPAPGIPTFDAASLGLGAPTLDMSALSALLTGGSVPGAASMPAAAPVVAFQCGVQLNGTVKRWDDQKGFGFIVPDGGGPDVFVHIGDLPGGNKLVNGAKVVFEAMQDASKGPGRYRAKTCTGGVPKETPTTEAVITDNLFITGLPLDIAEETAKAVFSQYGGVLSLKKLQNQPGKPDAACLVRMASLEQADWMVKNVSNNIPTGMSTPVSIRFAENKGRGAGGGRAGPY